MAQEEGSSWWNSWTSEILENVREKTSTALELVQNDLSEFVSTIQHDTSIAIADSATAVNSNLKINENEKDATTGKLKKGFSDLLTSISTTLHNAAESTSVAASSFEDESKTDEQRSRSAMMPLYDRTQVRLQEVQTNPETYCSDPDGEAYQKWCNGFDLDAKKGEISELLVNNPEVRRLYTKFVPSVQSHSTFWHRYFFKVYELEQENKRLADIVARASKSDNHEQDLQWDDEDDEEPNASVTLKETDGETADSEVIPDVMSSHKILQQEFECTRNEQETDQSTLSCKPTLTVKKHSSDNTTNQNYNEKEDKRNKENTQTEDKEEIKDPIPSEEINQPEVVSESSVLQSCVEAKSEEDKSDSSDSNSWIRVSDKEGSSSNSSSSVVVVNEKDREDGWNDKDDDKDDDDDEFGLNEDISNEDVEKLVQSITANELDSDEDDWEDWE